MVSIKANKGVILWLSWVVNMVMNNLMVIIRKNLFIHFDDLWFRAILALLCLTSGQRHPEERVYGWRFAGAYQARVAGRTWGAGCQLDLVAQLPESPSRSFHAFVQFAATFQQ